MSLRIVHVAKVAGISGAENHLLLLLPALRARGHDVRLVMLHEGEPGAAELADRLATDGVPVERLRMRAPLDPLVFGRLVRAIRRARPDVLHTHLVHADFHAVGGRLSDHGMVIYPGKLTQVECFRLGNIGHLFPPDIHALLEAIKTTLKEMSIPIPVPAPKL